MYLPYLNGLLHHGGSREEEDRRCGFELAFSKKDESVLFRDRAPPLGAEVVGEKLFEALPLSGALR